MLGNQKVIFFIFFRGRAALFFRLGPPYFSAWAQERMFGDVWEYPGFRKALSRVLEGEISILDAKGRGFGEGGAARQGG